EYATNASLATSIPNDDTIPQIGEGTQILSVSITATRSTSRIFVQFRGWGVFTGAATALIAALFKDGAANAVQVAATRPSAADTLAFLALDFNFAPGDTNAHTLTLRVGTDGTAVWMNGTSAGRKYGGASAATLTAWEVFA